MSKKYNVLEVTKENEHEYLSNIVKLEELVLDKMEKDGKTGQLFITDEQDIKNYIESYSNHVMIATKSEDDKSIISTAYITHGQQDFTYNDITKYFKSGKGYEEYVKTKYSESEYKQAIRKAYTDKITAFVYSRDVILKQNGINELNKMSEHEKNKIFMKMVEKDREDSENGFQEISKIRDNLNEYMTKYIKSVRVNINGYRDFYWIDFDFLKQNCMNRKNDINPKKSVKKCIKNIGEICNKLKNYIYGSNDQTLKITKSLTDDFDSTIRTYDQIMKYQKYNIKDSSQCKDFSKYYNANTSNTIELDTYITHPCNRENGVARILVLEGLKKSAQQILERTNNKEIFIASTLHKDNLSSKYVSEFFGLEDYIFVNRRTNRDRQVHFLGMKSDEMPIYIEKMEKKIAVLYGYNPSNIKISDNEKMKILNEQITYEIEELKRLNKMQKTKRYTDFSGYIKGKKAKIRQLTQMRDSDKNYDKHINNNNITKEDR